LRSEDETNLLRRFEPILRYDRGERFFPMAVSRYAQECSLWHQCSNQEAQLLWPPGEVTLDRLARLRGAERNGIYFLKLEPTTPPANRPDAVSVEPADREAGRDTPRAGRGRLARVGYLSRLVDAGYTIVLLARGHVPSERATAAASMYARIRAEADRFSYYGRVVQEGGWTVLQYWLFYLFDDWRSGFSGANDHDADWEMVSIYLGETEGGQLTPEWIVASCHDYSGKDLVCRWDESDLQKLDGHPVIYVGAGSHAGYYAAGEYLTELQIPFLKPLSAAVEKWRELWHNRLRQYRDTDDRPERAVGLNLFCIPFVDYARGDGLAIGPGHPRGWATPCLLSPTPEWVRHYRGLWGFYARDPFAHEDAPAGPMHNRDGTPRQSWYDSVGWAGLEKVPTWTEALAIVDDQLTRFAARPDRLEASLDEKGRELKRLYVELVATEGRRHLAPLRTAHQDRIAELSRDMTRLRAQAAAGEELGEALRRYAQRLKAGNGVLVGAPTNRIRRPSSESETNLRRLAEFWAAASVGLLFIGIVALAFFARESLVPGVIGILAAFALIESGLRGRVTQLVGGLTVGLATAAAVVLLYEFLWWLVVLAILAIGCYILWENLRELRNG
jgi:hypothetical protein